MILTNHYQALMIALLSQKTKAGIRTPHKGHQRPLSNVVFLCPSKTQAALCRLNSVMAGCIGQPLKRLAGSFAGSLNPIQSAAQRLRPKGSGLFPYKGVSAMRKYAQTTAKSSQYKQSLFSVYHNQNLIAFNVPGVLAFRLKQRKPAAIVKFSRMGGAA
jgi:hypothetical protein